MRSSAAGHRRRPDHPYRAGQAPLLNSRRHLLDNEPLERDKAFPGRCPPNEPDIHRVRYRNSMSPGPKTTKIVPNPQCLQCASGNISLDQLLTRTSTRMCDAFEQPNYPSETTNWRNPNNEISTRRGGRNSLFGFDPGLTNTCGVEAWDMPDPGPNPLPVGGDFRHHTHADRQYRARAVAPVAGGRSSRRARRQSCFRIRENLPAPPCTAWGLTLGPAVLDSSFVLQAKRDVQLAENR